MCHIHNKRQTADKPTHICSFPSTRVTWQCIRTYRKNNNDLCFKSALVNYLMHWCIIFILDIYLLPMFLSSHPLRWYWRRRTLSRFLSHTYSIGRWTKKYCIYIVELRSTGNVKNANRWRQTPTKNRVNTSSAAPRKTAAASTRRHRIIYVLAAFSFVKRRDLPVYIMANTSHTHTQRECDILLYTRFFIARVIGGKKIALVRRVCEYNIHDHFRTIAR